MKIENVIKTATVLSLNKKALLNIIYTHHLLTENFNEILKKYDLSPEQYNVLNILRSKNGKPLNMFEIQEQMISKASNTTRLVDKLLLKGYITREVCSKNRRKIDVFITKSGVEVLTDLKPVIHIYEQKLSQNLTFEELENLNFLLEKYRNT
ncbi:MarR family winged helix-turn-helix transcriptional regulator [Flavobacterium sp. N1736]|uniref:MarR family winged helix-turn-helix transcriptional regulator n=1 Tax=Flavobacterium sp. N1736 TaxID=2986823 RepID=UPI0022244E34|nr:MarR family transcriptional regulator [Flavobacterium sp. N1736]